VLIHLGSGRHFDYIEYVMDNDTINATEVLDFAAHIIYTTALLTCRLSGLAFYDRIAGRHPALKWAIRGAAAFMICGYLPQLFLIIFHCLPVTGLWPYSFQPAVNDFKCLQWGLVYVTNTVISLVCDFLLFTIPSAILYLLKVPLKKKLMLAGVLMPGLLVIALSIARMYFVIDSQWEPDESWVYDPFLAIEVAEVGLTLIALSAPALKPFFGSVFAFLDHHREHTEDFWVAPRAVEPTRGFTNVNQTVVEASKTNTQKMLELAMKVTASPAPSHRESRIVPD